MSLSLVKTGAIAATAILMTVTGAFAATYGTINYDTKVKKSWYSGSPTVSYVDEGDYVKIIDYTHKNGGWFRIDPPGPNNAGWVKDSAIDLDHDYYDPNDPQVKFCFYGPLGGYICVKN